jgi:hypothetical protein
VISFYQFLPLEKGFTYAVAVGIKVTPCIEKIGNHATGGMHI